ncbi:hypothetical protein EYD45_13680 [Hyunsoonleella flava]|uniref:Lipoprotein n=1 Tax=Hyunsoonleella flava TaxID=2527939 RepID=A0A4Q9FC52_9FLAO|nr:DUF6252 family protein [Hyunsoonleella flava]TBN00871.1 hypothetical protein EYD45_13680 [Hyunsoonleella flava]
MRNLKQIMLFVMVGLLLAFTSCSKDDDGNGGGAANGDEFVTVKIDGANFSASMDPASLISAVVSNGVLAVQGSTNDGKYVTIRVFNYSGAGTYRTGDAASNASTLMYGEVLTDPTDGWISNGIVALGNSAATGTLTVNSDDGSTVEGTFSFTGYNGKDMTTKSFTEGKFKAVIE